MTPQRRNMIQVVSRSLLLWLLLGSTWPIPAVATLRDIRVEGKAPAEYVALHTGQAWAVVIGIDEYAHAPRLAYAVADARSMAEVFTAQGFQVTTLYNEQATREAVLHELGDVLPSRVGEVE